MKDLALVSSAELERKIEEAVSLAVGEQMRPLSEGLRGLQDAALMAQGIYTKRTLARVLDVSPETVMEYVREHGLPVFRPVKDPLFLMDEVQAWVRQHPDLEKRQAPRGPAARLAGRPTGPQNSDR